MKIKWPWFAYLDCLCVYLLLLPLVWCVSGDKCKYTCTNKLSCDPYTPLRDIQKQHTYTLKHSSGLMCVFLLEARWWGLVCDGGQQWPQTLNREASIPLHPSDTHTHRLAQHSLYTPPPQRDICYVRHTHAARVHCEVLDRVRRWTSVTPRPFHLRGGLHWQRHKSGHPGCYAMLTSRDFVCSSYFSSFFALNCICFTLQNGWSKNFIVWIWFCKTGLSPWESAYDINWTFLSSTVTLSWNLIKGFCVCQVKLMFKLFDCGRLVFKNVIRGEIVCWNCNGHSDWSLWFVSIHGCCFHFGRCW